MSKQSFYKEQKNMQLKDARGGEKKVMKKSLSILLILSLVFTMFSGVASAADANLDKLKAAGIIIGGANGDTMDGSTWKRQDTAVILARLLGQEAQALATPKGHTYTDVTNSYYDGVLTWARNAGLMQGHSSTKFGFDEVITAQAFATVLVRALNGGILANDFENAIATTIALGILPVGTNKGDILTRGQTYGPIVAALNTTVNGKQLGTTLGLLGWEVPLAVQSVAINNLKQVVVTFTSPVDAVEGAKLANYQVGLSAAPGTNVATGAGSGVSLSADGLKATITIGNAAPAFVNTSTANKVTVKAAVGLAADYVHTAVVATDGTAPTIVSASTISPREIMVVFSEPLNEGALTKIQTSSSFQFENNTIMLEPNLAVYHANKNAIVLTSQSDINEREHVLNVNKTANNNLVDFVGYKVIPGQVSFTHVKNTTAPTVTIESSTESTITLKFSKVVSNVDDPNFQLNHTYPTTNPVNGDGNGLAIVENKSTTTNHEDTVSYTVTFQNPFPPGVATIYIGYANASGTKVVDAWGNALAPINLSVNTVNDVTKPTVTKAEFVDKKTIKVTFSESVDEATAETLANYTLKDSAGTTINVTGAVRHATTTSVVNLTTDDMVGGVYSLTVKNVRDISHAGNAIADVTVSVTATDSVPPRVVDDEGNNVDEGIIVTSNKVVVRFSEVMMKSSIEDKNNWRKGLNKDALDAGDTVVAAADNKSVVITLAAGTFTAGANLLHVGQVKDAAGNEIAKLETNLTLAAADLIIPDVEATGSKTVVLKFNEVVSAATVDDFEISVNGIVGTYDNPIVVSQTVADGKSTITLTLGAQVPSISDNANGGQVFVRAVGTSVKNQYGTSLDLTAKVAADKIAPTLLITEVISEDEIILTYSEAINAASVNKFTYTVAGETVASAVAVGTEVTITVNGAPTLPTVTQVVKIQDVALNDKAPSTSTFGVTASGVTLGATNVGTQGSDPINPVPGVSTFTFSSGFANTNTFTIGGQALEVDSTAPAGTNAIVKPLGNTGADMALAVEASLEVAGGIAAAAGAYTATVADNVLTLTEVAASGTNVTLTIGNIDPGATITKADTTNSVAAFAGTPEVASVTVTSGNKQSSFVVTFDGVSAIVSVLASDDSAAVAAKIVTAINLAGPVGNYTITNAGAVINFTTAPGVGVETDLTRSISN